MVVLFSAFSGAIRVLAEETYVTGTVSEIPQGRFNNENWYTLPHPKIAQFTVRDDGSAFGITETGVSFKQYNVPNDVGMRVQRFEIEDHYHYIVDGYIINSFNELSQVLAQAYRTHTTAV